MRWGRWDAGITLVVITSRLLRTPGEPTLANFIAAEERIGAESLEDQGPAVFEQTTRIHPNMKSQSSLKLGAILTSAGIALTGLQAQTETLLESFEDNIDNVTVVGGNNRGDEDIAFSQYTKSGDDDLAVTDGEKALMITITGNLAWNRDADITLSDEASALVKQAWAKGEEARYVIRYDVQFNNEGVGWGNFITWVNGKPYGQLELGSGLNNSFSLPLDVMNTDLSQEGPVILNIVGQYDANGEATSKDVIVDNIRLVDNYAPGAIPETTILNSFETEEDVNKLVPVSDRYTASLYKKTGPDDIAVTEGEGSLQVEFTSGGSWTRDFTIPFTGTIMETVARVAKEDRWRYTIRLDYIFADTSEGWNGNWQNVSIRAASGAAQPLTMFREIDERHVRTLSLPLDQLDLEPGDPGDPDRIDPGISIINQGAWGDGGMTLHIDNIRLIDTGKAPLKIGDLVVNEAGDGVDISWASSPSQAYGISVSDNLTDWTDLVTDVLGAPGEETTYTDPVADFAGQQFYRVFVSGSAPPLNEGFENGVPDGWTTKFGANHTGDVVWEFGAPSNGPDAAKTGTGVAGTDLDNNYTPGTWVILESPLAASNTLLEPKLTFSYFLDVGEGSAARVRILDQDGAELYAPGSPEEALFFVESTENWQDMSFDLNEVAGGQKVIVQFELIGNGDGAGFFVDDVLIDE